MFDIKKLEKLLLTNWTSFIDSRKLFALILSKVRDSNLPSVKNDSIKEKSPKITLSQFIPDKNSNFIIWVDFIIPKDKQVAIGTCELKLNLLTGNIEHLQTIGNLIS